VGFSPDGMGETIGSILWERLVRGADGHNPFFDATGTALYMSDGWGKVAAPALRFRRLDAFTGTEMAAWPCGSAVRCSVPLDGGDLLVATDQRLVRLDSVTLAERARWDPSARHANTLAVSHSVVVAANWLLPTVTLVDMNAGTVRRRRTVRMTGILARPGDDPLLVGGSAGGIATIDPQTGKIRRIRAAPPAITMAMSSDGRGVWLVVGNRAQVATRQGGVSLWPGAATTRLEWHPLAGGEARVVEVPHPVRTIAVSGNALWLTPGPVVGSPQFVVCGDSGATEWRTWNAPDGQRVQAVAPGTGLVLTSAAGRTGFDRLFQCHQIAGPNRETSASR
jgi:hypothetical protein